MKTSVIVTCYNQEKYIAQCLDSIVFNLIPDLELIICDDCSTDSSVQIISKWIVSHTNQFDRIKFIQHQKNCGVTLSLNELISECRGDFISPLAGDDYYLSGAIKARRDALASHPEWLGAFNDGLAFGDTGEVYARSICELSPMKSARLSNNIAKEVIYNWCEPINLQFWRASAFKCHGGDFEFNNEVFGEDIDFALMALAREAFGYLNMPCYAYRCRSWPQSSTGDPRPKWMDMAFLFGHYANSFEGDLKTHMLHRADYYYSLAINNIDRITETYKKFSESVLAYHNDHKLHFKIVKYLTNKASL